MCVLERIRNLRQQLGRLFRSEGNATAHLLFKRAPVKPLHHQVSESIMLADIRDGDDVLMQESSGGERFALKKLARSGGFIFCQIRLEDFNGDCAPDSRCHRTIDCAEAAHACELFEAITPVEYLADQTIRITAGRFRDRGFLLVGHVSPHRAVKRRLDCYPARRKPLITSRMRCAASSLDIKGNSMGASPVRVIMVT